MPHENRADWYRARAAEARRQADAINDQVLKASFLAAEQAWLELAEQAEGLDRHKQR